MAGGPRAVSVLGRFRPVSDGRRTGRLLAGHLQFRELALAVVLRVTEVTAVF
jgi:hypothetical protein